MLSNESLPLPFNDKAFDKTKPTPLTINTKEKTDNPDTSAPLKKRTVSIQSVLQVIAHLDQSEALSGRQISEIVQCTPRDIQKLLPNLKRLNRVSRVLRKDEFGRERFHYWMNDEQRKRFEGRLSRNSMSKAEQNKEIQSLRQINRKLQQKIDNLNNQIKDLQDKLACVYAANPNLYDPVVVSGRLRYINNLLERPALKDHHQLHGILNDYRLALDVAREAP